tara:strand:- start:1327 stop:1737 length:411 start_codon:yes stop_codon:yes gene_type:complete
MLKEIKSIKPNNKELKNFGIFFTIIILLITLLFFEKNKFNYIFIYFAFILISISFYRPTLLKPIYFIWFLFSILLGEIMTRLILGILFYFIISPIGVFLRLIGKDLLYRNKINKKYSYWNYRSRQIEDKKKYENQY